MAEEFEPKDAQQQVPQSDATNQTSESVNTSAEQASSEQDAPLQSTAEYADNTDNVNDTNVASAAYSSAAYSVDTQQSDTQQNTAQVDQQEATEPLATVENTQAQTAYTPAPEYGAYGATYDAESSASSDTQTQQYATPQFGQYATSQPSQPSQSNNQYGVGQYGNQYSTSQSPYASQYGQQYGQSQDANQQGQYASQQANQPYWGQQQYSYAGTSSDEAAANDPQAQAQTQQAQQTQQFTTTRTAPDGQPDGQQQRRQPNTIAVAVTTGIITVIVSVAMCLGLGMAAINNGWVQLHSTGSTSITSNTGGSGTAQAVSGQAPDWQQVAKNVSSSVVAIQTEVEQNGQSGIAKGSGAIISKDGDVVTNNHVVTGAKQIQVTLSNGQVYEAELVGTDVTTDLAVIKIKNAPSDLTPVTFADSDKLAVGENIMAIGNPLGYENTATTGIVSALNRPVTVMDEQNNQIVTNAVQIDAAINPGNSGGPTFNAAGQVIGINSSIATASSASSSSEAGSIGIGFAIPSNLVKRVATEIEKNGKVQHVALGVTVTSGSAEVDGATRTGAKITSSQSASNGVVEGSPAAKAGLKANDVIIGYNGKAVNSVASLLGYVRASSMGETVTLTVVRDGKSMDVQVTLDQAEEAVNGTNRQDNSSRRMQGNNDSNGSNGNNGDSQGNSNNGNSDNGSGKSLDPFDPFGFGW
ncbi:peptidase [Galliscardovia ingluviei]|uniref:Peptidase n=1 Tax=Galliscardovia ingluviei TaxID=1769422 RepID=A0A8J3AI80_9BIFI|nr:trypsin-like peptidase domain-containing protein [Galliscardovia ingluviei]GGI14967.1 peptidase [Galliscardovia ingluviei]